MTFGAALRQARELAGKEQRQVAAELGISAQYLSDIEHDRRAPLSDEFIERAAGAVQVPADYLYFMARRLPPDIACATDDRVRILAGLRALRAKVR